MNDIRGGLPSASKLERIMACHGSHAIELLVEGEEEVEEITESGTRIHKARETRNTLELNSDEFSLYESGLRYEQRLLEKWKGMFGFSDNEVKEGLVELRLWLHNHKLEPVGSGQLDVHYICRDYAHVIDWKTGFLPHLTGATGNAQLRMQAVLLWLEHPHLKNIRVAFAKPRYENSELDYCDYEEQDLKNSHDSILLALWWATQPDAVRTPGNHCRWCKAKTICPQALAFALLPSQIIKGVRPRKPELLAAKTALATPDDLYRLWETGSTIRAILDAVNDRLKAMTDEELQQLALMKGAGRKTLKWNDPKGAVEFLISKGWDEKEIFGTAEFGLGKLGVLAQKYLGVDEKFASDSVKELLRDFIVDVEGAATIKKLR